jgi:hypothetical protein
MPSPTSRPGCARTLCVVFPCAGAKRRREAPPNWRLRRLALLLKCRQIGAFGASLFFLFHCAGQLLGACGAWLARRAPTAPYSGAARRIRAATLCVADAAACGGRAPSSSSAFSYGCVGSPLLGADASEGTPGCVGMCFSLTNLAPDGAFECPSLPTTRIPHTHLSIRTAAPEHTCCAQVLCGPFGPPPSAWSVSAHAGARWACSVRERSAQAALGPLGPALEGRSCELSCLAVHAVM